MISWQGVVKLKTSKNRIGSRVAELVVNGVRGPWLLDRMLWPFAPRAIR
jgi:hypothetical protein